MKKYYDALKATMLFLIPGVVISWVSGTSPNEPSGYNIDYFYAGLFFTIFLMLLMLLHILLDRKNELVGLLAALFMLMFWLGYIPLRMIYWSVSEPWIWVVFPALIVVAVLIPLVNPRFSKEMAEEYINPSPAYGGKLWKIVSFWVPIVGVGMVFIAKIFESPSGLIVFSILGFGVYIGMLWTIQTNVHNFIQKKKEDKKAKDE